MEETVKNLAKKIDEGLMELDYQLCRRAIRENVPRAHIAMVDLSASMLAGMLAAFCQDANLWAEFSWEVGAPREPAFERLYQRAQLVGRSQPDSNGSLARQQALTACDPNGLTQRINQRIGEHRLDGLTLGAVAYVLGRKPTLWKAVQAAMGPQ